MCDATADDHEFSHAEDVCGQAWRHTARRQHALAAPRLAAQNRSNLYHSTAHPAWPNCRPVFHSLQGLPRWHEHSPRVSKARGRGRQHACPHAHLAMCTGQVGSARETQPFVSPCDGRPYQTATATSDVGVPSPLTSKSMGDIAASATSFRYLTFHHNLPHFHNFV